jgi:outer membrane protein assembly factor BamB
MWDGRLYLLGGLAGDHKVFAVDLLTGEVLARKSIRNAATSRPVVWDHRVFLRTNLDEITVLRPSRRGFKQVWRFKPKLGRLVDPIVFQGEIYTVASGRLIRLREGRNNPIWSTPVRGIHGRPALYGDHVYALVGRGGRLHLYAFNRSDGFAAARIEVAQMLGGGVIRSAFGCEITVLEERVYVRSAVRLAAQGGTVSNAGIGRRARAGEIGFGEPIRLYHFASSPAAHRDGLVALAEDPESAWVLWKGTSGGLLAKQKEQPDFFLARSSPTVVGDVVYFGTWAADIKTLDVLWRLPHERLRFPVVPADRMIVVVDEEGRVIAYGD